MVFLKTAWRHIRRSPYQAFAAIFIITQTFFVISLFAFIIYGSARTLSYFESLPQVTAFFKNEAKQEEIDALKKQLTQTGKVEKIEFVSKEEGLKIYKQQNQDDPLLLELVSADFLPSAFKISAVKISDLSSISDMLGKSSIVHRIIFQKDVVKNLTAWTSFLRKTGMVFITVLALDSIFVMVILIGIKISQKKDEIEIMRLLGATSWYVRWPFILEGIFYGIIGAFVGWSISSIVLLWATPLIASFIGGIPVLPVPALFFLELFGTELLIAVFLGAFSSFLAVLRYLK